MNLHNEIMNIQCDSNDECTYKYGQEHHHTSYKLGHRDARHAAAELSLKAEARIEELRDILTEVLNDSGFRNLDEKLQEKIWKKM